VRLLCAFFGAALFCSSLSSAARADDEEAWHVPPRVMPYDDEKPIPLGYHVESHPRQGMIIGGVITFTVSYVFLLGSDDPVIAIPIAGPFIRMQRERDACRHMICDQEGSLDLFYWASGLGQLVGAGLITIGYTSPRQTLVRGVQAFDPGSRRTAFSLTLSPAFAGPRSVGLLGTF
jgi:hypothetical protein